MKNIFVCLIVCCISLCGRAQGVSKNGRPSGGTTTFINRNGQTNAGAFVNKNGKIITPATPDGKLTYQIFNSPASFAYSESDFLLFTNSDDLMASGTRNANVLLDWTDFMNFQFAGIGAPTWGDKFAIMISGTFIPEETGTYTFTCVGDDAVDLFINNVNVANYYGSHAIGALGSTAGSITLEAGNFYSFRARMQENGGQEGLRVFWRKPSQASGWYINTTELSSVVQ